MRGVPRPLSAVTAAFALALTIGATAAPAHGPQDKGALGWTAYAPIEPPQAAYKGLEKNPSGKCKWLYEVKSKGKDGKERTSCTHGPDPSPPGTPTLSQNRSVEELAATTASGPSTPQSVMCDGGDSTGMRVEAIYAYPADQPNRSATVIPLIRGWASEVDDIYY